MTAATRKLIRAALFAYRGDDYARAIHAFRGLTPKQMQEPHGASGKTRQQILDGYREHAEAVDAALVELED